jgi:hypothetical protein
MKKSELKKYIKEMIVSELTEVDTDKTRGTVIMPKTTNPIDIKKLTSQGVDIELKEEDMDDDVEVKDDWNKVDKEDSFVEKEPTAKDLKKGDKITKTAAKLAMLTKEMKSVVSQWKKAEGTDKAKFLDRLKELTKIKKELEAIITPTIGDED